MNRLQIQHTINYNYIIDLYPIHSLTHTERFGLIQIVIIDGSLILIQRQMSNHVKLQ